MKVFKSDGTCVDDKKDVEFGWYFSEIAVDEGDDRHEEYNRETRSLSKLRKSLTKENLLESIDLPDIVSEPVEASGLSADAQTVPILKRSIPFNRPLLKNSNYYNLPSKEKLAEIINPCNPESKMLLSVINHAKYKSLVKEEVTEELLKTVNLKTTNFKCLMNDRKHSLSEDMYKEIVNYHANKEESMMSLMMELILTDVDCNLDDIIDIPEPEVNTCPTELSNFIIETSDLENSIPSRSSSGGSNRQDSNNLLPSDRSNILSSIGLSEEDKSIQDFCAETYGMHCELAKIRRSFQESEAKVNKLLKQAKVFKSELRETMFLDDLLHLLNGDLEKVKSDKLPFKIFHKSDPEESELNFIV